MMTRPDFISKQILFIESNKSNRLKLKNSNLILVDENNKTLLQHPCIKIFMVFIYGDFTITSMLIKEAKKNSISFIFLNFNLKPYYSIIPDNKGNFLLRKIQYTNNNDLEIAKHLIYNKMNNQLNLMKSLRYKTIKEKDNIKKIKILLDKIKLVDNSQDLLGIEGNGAKLFFKTYFKNLKFKGRKPRCKDSIVNLLFDIGYYYLFNFIDANLELYGFDNYYGVFHKCFFQRKSLVCDIIEPFRCIIDKKIKKMYNLKQVKEEDFQFRNDQYSIKIGFSKKYSKLFLEEIIKNRERIFLYIQSYYRSFVKNREIDDYPYFSYEV